ncbi:hypothetical protein O3M35_002117 [Rhynocoris fuscipes]|uniref:Biogenesis of lysosome-related organelles complex 1 subunit 3 n=1 Tax=Rhynocoris fuscipes TaxID=488301 RepID=A0AAW1CTY7_9HEMI
MDSKNSLIVVGEASESDDEVDSIPQEITESKSVSFNGAVIVGSDSDSDDNYAITAEAFASKFEEFKPANPRFNTILHKKLKESNTNLSEDIIELVKSSYKFASEQMREISNCLMEAQIDAAETQKNLRSSLITMEKVDWALNDLLSTSFLSKSQMKL